MQKPVEGSSCINDREITLFVQPREEAPSWAEQTAGYPGLDGGLGGSERWNWEVEGARCAERGMSRTRSTCT